MVSTIIVFTGHFRGRRLIAEKIARWLEAPCLFMESILEGLRPCNIGNSTLVGKESMFEQLLQSFNPVSRQDSHPTIHAYAYGEEEAKYLAQTALRLLLCQLPHLTRTMNYIKSCIVLELSWCSSEIVEMFMAMLNHHLNKSVFDRGLIIECMTRGEACTEKWRQFEEDKMYRGTFSGGHDRTYYWDDLEKAVEQQLYLLSSKFEEVKMLHCGRFKDRFVSRLKMDPSLDFDYLRDPLRAREARTVPSKFHQAVHCLAFKEDIDISACFNSNMREWEEFCRKFFIHWRTKSAGCFTGEIQHMLCTSNDHSLSGGDRCCRLCGKEVRISRNNFESFYYCCLDCPLNLHKACAECLDDSSVKLPSPAALAANDKLMSLMEQEDKGRTVACPSCKTKGKCFHRKCLACRFDTFLKCRLLPTVVPSPFGNQQSDFFVTRITSITENVYPCAACGDPILLTTGSMYYAHSSSSLRYGFACVALLPRDTLHTHFGYRHLVKLMDKPHQDLDNYICDVCWQERDPVYWYYYCKECDFTAHVYCICDDIPHHSRYH